jgi:uncharacterized protein (TIGR03437 family)
MFIRTASDLGALIRERRLKFGLDQLALARKAGTSRKWLVEVENGKPRAEIGLILRTVNCTGMCGATPGPGFPSRTTAQPLSYTTPVDGGIAAPGQVDQYTFAGTADDVLEIRLQNQEDQYNPYMCAELRTPQGANLVSMCGYGTPSGSVRPVNSGAYTIRVSMPNNNIGVYDAASQLPSSDTISPGEMVTIFGTNLAKTPAKDPNGVPVTQLGGVQAQLGGQPVGLFYVGPNQINAVVPFGLTVGQTLQLIVQRDGYPSVPLSLTVVPARPGIFTTAQTGAGQAAILGPSGQIANTQNPAHGGGMVSIFCAGLGPVNPTVGVTSPAPSQEPLARLTGSLGVIIGNVSAEVLYAGLAPGYYGLYQINARVPANAQLGDTVPVQVSVDNFVSNGASIAIH